MGACRIPQPAAHGGCSLHPEGRTESGYSDVDDDIHHRINDLAREEEDLYLGAARDGGLDQGEKERLRVIQVQLDQAYDLLHQRDARRAAGLDPLEASVRPIETVEHYEQ